ncbi:MAG: HAD hydrolase-like protein [Oscillospiraceae bacterium]|nr:HAD hydrolase-like protein [Oscillospiraceae bacterium]
MKYDLVIFDFDGTLADTSLGIFNSIRHASAALGLPEIPQTQMRSFIGPPLSSAYISNFGLSGEVLETAMRLHKEYGVAHGYKELEFYNGIFSLLEYLKKAGVQTAIATLKVQPTLNKIVEEFDCSKYFDICKGADLGAPMTKAEMLRFCISQAGNIPDTKAVLVGDSIFDAEGAQEAGIDFIAVTYGFGFAKGEKFKLPCVAEADSVEELSGLFENMR